MFAKVLIANRGEIACRILRTARRMGLSTVAVYSEADADAHHLALADEAWPIGPAPARQSYLCIDKIIEVARQSGAEAIHPGYGFLSENAAFADACAEAGLIFIGPPPAAIRAMGSKSEAKTLMAKAGVPLVPGYHGLDQTDSILATAAEEIGFPVLIKASAGGGGKGMRVVDQADAFAEGLAAARREAANAFGDDRVLIEKYLIRPRHVESQVFADSHGHCVHLLERDCSIQRRHQKVVEEAPAPGMTPALREKMGAQAVAAARAIGYQGAGTVEFLLDSDGRFYFMEMNTRLQVEHPVTEMITGLDLVEWQFLVAAGAPLPLQQSQIVHNGHAIEVRIYAEDPDNDFLPATGMLRHLRFPEAGRHIRIDSGVVEGDRISVHYDPMIAKLAVWDESRAQAVHRLRRALASVEIAGLTTNSRFLAAIAGHPAFLAAATDTGFIPRHQQDLFPPPSPTACLDLCLASLAVLLERSAAAKQVAAGTNDPHSPWAKRDGWRLNEDAEESLRFRDGGQEHLIALTYRPDGYRLQLAQTTILASGRLGADGVLVAQLDGVIRRAGYARHGAEVTLFVDGRTLRLTVVDPLEGEAMESPTGGLLSPMPGTLTAILVEAGSHVSKGQPLAVMEAMKMEHTLRAPHDGVVTALLYKIGDLVEEGVELVAFSAAEEA
ncbi:MAG TPA: acetyl/propionyl/methylcrotonyl-CoA carboxylase subunit alpha [Rhodospirillaceae bacterium]|nr:acetyl/propionyl/methylcrotonyl-CoA carboxylase subunit alpha [Rhodospirillaceae bacterium]